MFVDSNSSLAVLACGIAKGSFSWILFTGIHILWEILHKEYLCSYTSVLCEAELTNGLLLLTAEVSCLSPGYI